MENIVMVVGTALISGLLATLITIWWQSRSAVRKSKMEIFETLMAYRYMIPSEPSVHALNSVEVVFYRDKNVREAYADFLNEAAKPADMNPQTADKHLKLLEEMARALKLKNVHWDDIKHVYFPIGLLDKIREEDLLRKMQLQVTANTIESQKEPHNGPTQEQMNQQMLLQLLHELMRNPEGLKTLMEIGEKYGAKK